MSDKTGTCKLCQKTKILRNSHLIPKSIYKYTNDQLNRSLAVTLGEVFKPIQSGIKEYLLCDDCEVIMQGYERPLEKYLKEVTTSLSTNSSQRYVDYNNANMHLVKSGILSIIWRISVCESKEFKPYQLGPFQEEFRNLLLTKKTLTWDQYPMMIQHIVKENIHLKQLIMCFDRGRYSNNLCSVQCIALAGMYFSVYMTEEGAELFGEDKKLVFSQDSSSISLYADSRDVLEGDPLIQRYAEKEVKKAMGKLKYK